MIKKKILLILDKDLDGIACGITYETLNPEEEVEIITCYNDEVDDVVLKSITKYEQYKKIYIVDTSVSDEVAEKIDSLDSNYPNILLFDHHKTSERLNKYSWATIERNTIIDAEVHLTCGAELFFKYLIKNDVTEINAIDRIVEFIEIVRRYDTWEWTNIYNDLIPKKMNMYLDIVGEDTFFKNMIFKIKENKEFFDGIDLFMISTKEKEINRYVQEKSKEVIPYNILGYTAGVIFAENYISELAEGLNELNLDYDLFIFINANGISYRAIKDTVDVGSIAKSFGGGGNPKTAGSPMNVEKLNKFLELCFSK